MTSVREVRDKYWEVAFQGIDTVDAAEALAGSFCLVARDDLPDIGIDEALELLVGFSVEDERYGALGVVREVRVSPAQALLVVEGERGEVLIPYVDEFVTGVSESARVVSTSILESLLLLNATASSEEGEE